VRSDASIGRATEAWRSSGAPASRISLARTWDVWATWHVMPPTMAELQELGVESGEMVRRYAHFARAIRAGQTNAREFSVPYEDRNAQFLANQQLGN